MKVFHIGGTLTAGGYLLPDLAGSYMKRHPDRILELKVANTNGIEEMISARKLDVALVEGPFEQKYFLSEPFIPDELLPAFAPGHCAEAFSLEEYIRCGGRLILRERGSGTRYYFDRFLQTRKLPEPPPRNILEVNSFDALKRFDPAGTRNHGHLEAGDRGRARGGNVGDREIHGRGNCPPDEFHLPAGRGTQIRGNVHRLLQSEHARTRIKSSKTAAALPAERIEEDEAPMVPPTGFREGGITPQSAWHSPAGTKNRQ